MNRFWAFLIHLGISLVIFAALAYLVVYVWYPGFFFDADGGWQGMRIIILVDLVLGPTLTLIVFNRTKPRSELRRDLTIIGVFQLSCLAAGTYVVHSERPLALVYVDGHFHSMSADDYRNAGLELPDFQGIPGPYPKRVVVDIPEDPFEQAEIRRSAIQQRQPLRALHHLYVPYDYARLDVSSEALSREWIEQRDADTGDISAWLTRHGGNRDDYAFFPFGARYGYLVLGIARDSGEIVGLLDTELTPRTGKPKAPAPGTAPGREQPPPGG